MANKISPTVKITLPSDQEVLITRVFDAPPAMVYKAWTDPKQLAKWWGPKIFTTPVCQMDVRPGGAYRIVMRSPDGTEYPMKGHYREVVAGQRIVYTANLSEHPDEWHDMIDPERRKGKGKPEVDAVTTVTFTEQHGETLISILMCFDSAAIRDAFLRTGMGEGWTQSFERLDALLVNV